MKFSRKAGNMMDEIKQQLLPDRPPNNNLHRQIDLLIEDLEDLAQDVRELTERVEKLEKGK